MILERVQGAVMIVVEEDGSVVVVVVVAPTEEDCVVDVAVTLTDVPLVGPDVTFTPFPSSNWK